MDREQRKFLERHFEAARWPKPAVKGGPVLRNFRFEGSEIPKWKLERAGRDESVTPPVIRSLWRRGESARELLSIDVFECASAKAARDQLIETLGNMQSGEIARRTGKNALGEVSFGLGDTMVSFVLGNTVVLVRNAGPAVVEVVSAAREIEKRLRPQRPKAR